MQYLVNLLMTREFAGSGKTAAFLLPILSQVISAGVRATTKARPGTVRDGLLANTAVRTTI